MGTDTKIADFILCAGKKCPHPSVPEHGSQYENAVSAPNGEFAGSPSNTVDQLLCMAEKCSKKTLTILTNQDSKDLMSCLTQRDLPELLPSLWTCLGNEACRQAVTCWSKPFESCNSDIWHALTDDVQRQRIDKSIQCLKGCNGVHSDDFVEDIFCVLDNCMEEVLSCDKDITCRSAVKCIPDTLGVCAASLFEAYTEQELLRNVTKLIGRGLEYCGAAVVEMLRDQDLADAIICNAQCTIPPAPADTTEVPTTLMPTTLTPTPASAACAANAGCIGLGGDCCPAPDGMMLACCSAIPPAPADTTEAPTTMTPKPASAACEANSGCIGLAGDCCPASDGMMLACCSA